MTKSVSTYSQSLSAHIAGNMSSETEQRFQRRGQHVQTKLAGIATSIHIPTEERQGWVMKMLVVLQKVVERLNESVKGGNTMEELSVGLENTETRRYFDECTKKFGINYDTVLDTTEEKDNFEEITKVVDEVFEEVKGIVQDTWIIQREEESRRLNRSRLVFEPTSSGVDPGGQMGPGTMMYDNLGIGGRNQGVFEYDGEPRTNGEQSNDQQNQQNGQQSLDQSNQPNQQTMQMMVNMLSMQMKHIQQEGELNRKEAELNRKHIQQEADRKASHDSELLEIAKRDETRKDHREDQKMNFANQAAAVAAFMRPASAKSFFGGKTLTEVTTTELGKYVDVVATFVETVD